MTLLSLVWGIWINDKVFPSEELKELRAWRSEGKKRPDLVFTLSYGRPESERGNPHPLPFSPPLILTNGHVPASNNVSRFDLSTSRLGVPLLKGKTNVTLVFGLANNSAVVADGVEVILSLHESLRVSLDGQKGGWDFWETPGSPKFLSLRYKIDEPILEYSFAMLPEITISQSEQQSPIILVARTRGGQVLRNDFHLVLTEGLSRAAFGHVEANSVSAAGSTYRLIFDVKK